MLYDRPPPKPLCPECKEAGKSDCNVYQHESVSTDMAWSPYWDKDGNYVNDDPNIRATHYSCSKGKEWHERY